ncbi:glycosyltransferase [Flammeovirga pectinis]|uniref:Glycosyltransferase n=1 Tax=Flammeovirga pectinis TaxID=2494373 RepID=A0A3S9P5K4_9BACT|nr:glycosyltransferase family 4 protein [Flammeovirga pectinis]AZQ63510.1 glycosyltransferase [Flammeovirga pectinis]
MQKKINFILPFPPDHPGGGTKMIFENAQRLANKGYDVAIYSNSLTKGMHKGNKWVKYFKNKFTKRYIPNWFEFHKSIQHYTIPHISDYFIRDADILITTWYQTALDCHKLSSSKGKKINYIQDYEIWGNKKDLVHQSYSLKGYEYIVISKYLYRILKKYTSKVQLISYGVNYEKFNIKTPIKDRSPYTVSMLYSREDRKNVTVAIEALIALKNKYPKLEAHFFGVSERPKNLDQDWIYYTQKPEKVSDIYNKTAIFLQPSYQEGLSLNPIEAKASGCACVYTNIDGHLDHSIDNVNCLLVPINDSQAFIDKVSLLIENNDKRIKMAQNGHDHIQDNFLWDGAIQKLENIILSNPQ